MKLEKNKSLKEYTTYRVGGNADFFSEAKNEQEILEAIRFSQKEKIPLAVIGNGSNLLINDKGFRGIVVKISNKEFSVISDNEMVCGAGLTLSELINRAHNNDIFGFWFLSGIPGTLGGAIYGNAGMANKAIGDILVSAKLIGNDGEMREVKKDYFDFEYRKSILKKTGEIVFQAHIRTEQISKDEELNNIAKMVKKRRNQPRGLTCGSIFKNPGEKKAGELIEKAGQFGSGSGSARPGPLPLRSMELCPPDP